LIPVGFGYGDGDEFFLRGWVWDSETRPRPAPLPSLHKCKFLFYAGRGLCGPDFKGPAGSCLGPPYTFLVGLQA